MPSLKAELAELLDRAPTADEMQRARQLFAIAIETPGGLKVQTIHAFCERLLQRFPLEAGVPPGFAILDDHERACAARRGDRRDADRGDGANAGAPLARALQTADRLRRRTAISTALLAEALREHDWLDGGRPPRRRRRWPARRSGGDLSHRLSALTRRRQPGRRSTAAARRGCSPRSELTRVRDVLASGSANDIKSVAERSHAALARRGGPSRPRRGLRELLPHRRRRAAQVD